MTRPRALITGASSGLGRGYALNLAADRYDLVLVARDEGRLREVARSIEAENGTHAEVVVADLSTRSGIAEVRTVIETSRIDLLINNAGYGLRQSLLESEIEELEGQDRVLTGAVRELSLAAVRQMRARGRGGLINVSSMAALTTMGQYAASKMSTLVFTEALAGELRGTSVTVTAVLPGFIRTRFHERLGVERPGPDRIWLTAQHVVAASLRDARRGAVVSIPGLGYGLAAQISRFIPRSLVRLGSMRFSLSRRDDH